VQTSITAPDHPAKLSARSTNAEHASVRTPATSDRIAD
jgi:hypothetical protein